MSWKDISKSSYSFSADKFKEWVPNHPFTVPFQANKISYSEGDEISTADNPVFNIETTGEPILLSHFPCGYWYKNYVPLEYIILTSKPYPMYVDDTITVLGDITGGSLAKIYEAYTIDPEILEFTATISSGNFREVYKTYSADPEITYIESEITGGILNQVYYVYDEWPSEEIEFNGAIISGTLNIILLTYEDWPPEELEFTGDITGGSHVSV